jgi:hypothetical protein
MSANNCRSANDYAVYPNLVRTSGNSPSVQEIGELGEYSEVLETFRWPLPYNLMVEP